MLKYCFGVIFLLISGCASDPWSRVESNVAAGYEGENKSIYVLSYLPKSQKQFDEMLNTELQEKLHSQGYRSEYVSSNGLELNQDVHLIDASKLGSNIIIVIDPSGGTKDQYGFLLLNAKYEVRVFDLNRKQIIFKSQIELHPRYDFWIGITWDNLTANKLANDILNELKNNNVI